MEADDLRRRAVESLERQRRTSVLFVAFLIGTIVLIAIWGLTGYGYFWPGWAMVVAALLATAVACVRSWSSASFAEATVQARMSQIGGQAPPGIQR